MSKRQSSSQDTSTQHGGPGSPTSPGSQKVPGSSKMQPLSNAPNAEKTIYPPPLPETPDEERIESPPKHTGKTLLFGNVLDDDDEKNSSPTYLSTLPKEPKKITEERTQTDAKMELFMQHILKMSENQNLLMEKLL